MQFRNHYNVEKKPKGMKTTMPGVTVPDQTMPVKEILLRYAKGLPISVKKPFEVTDDLDHDFVQWDRMDLVDKHRAIKERADELKKLKGSMDQRKKDKAIKALKDEIRKEIEDEQKQ